jgi:hypothetical protein
MCSELLLPRISGRGGNSMKQWFNDDWQGKLKILGVKFVPVPIRPPRISRKFTWN